MNQNKGVSYMGVSEQLSSQNFLWEQTTLHVAEWELTENFTNTLRLKFEENPHNQLKSLFLLKWP